ncbi:MAG: DUF4292 domain-containing protein [Bacteroidetes bacterium]|nr:DUF4292 domain-containing protein [Bacteroidota bacterium]MBU2505482.1 DUF4292 domain-containing protein [Bacteroidota bacterium]
MNRKFYPYVFIVLLLSFIIGCVPSKPVDEEKVFPADRLLKKLEGNRRKIKTFSGSGVLNITSPELTAAVNFQVYLKKPDSIKISVYGPFGIDLAHGLVTQNDFQFYDVLQNTLFTGNVEGEILKRIFKVDLSFEDLMDAFTGAVNLTSKLLEEPDEYETSSDKFILTYINDDAKTKNVYTIAASNLAITNYKMLTRKNKKILESEFKDFRVFENVPIPYLISVINHGNEQNLNIEYRKINVNNEIETMRLLFPKDIKSVKL